MTSLYKRATPSQAYILRVVEGAVKNACDAHPNGYRISPSFARSIAKRATGTLTAQWAEVLAARALSRKNRDLSRLRGGSERRPAEVYEPASAMMKNLHREITRRMRALRVDGHDAIYAACQDVLRRIAEANHVA